FATVVAADHRQRRSARVRRIDLHHVGKAADAAAGADESVELLFDGDVSLLRVCGPRGMGLLRVESLRRGGSSRQQLVGEVERDVCGAAVVVGGDALLDALPKLRV